MRLEKEAFKVLTQHGKELHVPHYTVQKRNKFKFKNFVMSAIVSWYYLLYVKCAFIVHNLYTFVH